MIAGGHGHGTVPVGLGGDVDPQNPGVEHVIRCLMTVGMVGGQPGGAGTPQSHSSVKQVQVEPVVVVWSKHTQFV